VSLSVFSHIAEWEQEDPLGALCRRIAFAARRERNIIYDLDFAFADVKPEQIIEWLGNNPRILLIDKLNGFSSLSTANSKASDALADFLKHHFLREENQYFVFSSHVVSTVQNLAICLMAGRCDRSVITREIPLIRNIVDARKIFKWPKLNLREALSYGLLPSLIYMARLQELKKAHNQYLPFENRDRAIDECLKDGLVTDGSVRRLLANFVTGYIGGVMETLHPFMNTAENGKLRWIPYHMMEVLRKFALTAPSSDKNLREAMTKIINLIHEFFTAKESAGKAWENLFLLLVMIRVVSREFDKVILPLDLCADYSISFNEFIRSDKKPLETIDNVDEFVGCFTEPDRYLHVAIYQPNASFPLFDLIIAVHDKNVQGQLKDRKEIPKQKRTSRVMTKFDACVLVRGPPPRGKKMRWIVPSTSQIANFFGESGKHWTPEELNKLMGGQAFEE